MKELADGRVFVVDEQKDLYQIMPDSNKLFITKLPITQNNYWHIQKNHLYCSHDEKSKPYLSRIDITTGHKKLQLMAENVWIQSFNLHPNGKKLLIVQSLLADSDLVINMYSVAGFEIRDTRYEIRDTRYEIRDTQVCFAG